MCASAAVIPITSFTTALDTLLSVLVQRSNVHNCIPNTSNYFTMCASAAVIFTTVFLIHFYSY